MSKPQIARKPGFVCESCGVLVMPGELCVDIAYLDNEGGGYFCRLHAACHELTQLFKEKMCGYDGWFGGMDLAEASEHAMSEGDDPFWRDWLLLYETTW